MDITELSVGLFVKIKGTVQPNGRFQAKRISIRKPEKDSEIEGPVQAVDQANRTLTVMGVPIRVDEEKVAAWPPRLIVTRDGKLVAERKLTDKKTLIGRSDFADMPIDDDYISKMHAVVLLYSDALVLLDLNSANGLTVNSRRVRSTILQTDDIVSIGHHRIKVADAPAISPEMKEMLADPDTIKMKNLVDMRRLRERSRHITVDHTKKHG